MRNRTLNIFIALTLFASFTSCAMMTDADWARLHGILDESSLSYEDKQEIVDEIDSRTVDADEVAAIAKELVEAVPGGGPFGDLAESLVGVLVGGGIVGGGAVYAGKKKKTTSKTKKA